MGEEEGGSGVVRKGDWKGEDAVSLFPKRVL